MMSQKFFACSKNLPICEHRINILLISQKYHINTNKAGQNTVETSSNRPKAFFSPEEAFVFEE